MGLQGNVIIQQREVPAAAPAVTGARNGATVVAGFVELGGVNPLLHNTTIDLATFSLAAAKAGNDLFLIDPTANLYYLGDYNFNFPNAAYLSVSGGGGNQIDIYAQDDATGATVEFYGNASQAYMSFIDPNGIDQSVVRISGKRAFIALNTDNYLDLDLLNGIYQMGDIAGVGRGNALIINDTSGSITLGDTNGISTGSTLRLNIGATPALDYFDNNGSYLELRPSTGIYSIGDLASIGNDTKIDIKDASTNIELDAGTTSKMVLSGGVGSEQLTVTMLGSGSTYLLIDPNAMMYQFGDISGSSTGTTLILDDANQDAYITSASGRRLSLQSATGEYGIGDLAGMDNATRIHVFDVTNGPEVVSMSSVTGTMFLFDNSNLNYAIGDLTPAQNGTKIGIDDFNSLITLGNTTANASLRMNGALGFTGTVTPVISITVNSGIVTAVT